MITLEATRVPVAESVRRIVLDVDGCHYCEQPFPSEVDHLLPVIQGGTNHLDNLVAACHRCNAEKSGMTPSQWRVWRIDRGRPWPPPSRSDALPGLLREIEFLDQLALWNATRAREAVTMAALDAYGDRVWLGRDGTIEDEAARVLAALDGVEERLARDRARCIARIVALPVEFAAETDRAIDRGDYPRGGFGPVYRRMVGHVASAVADLSTRLLGDLENERLSELVAACDDWTARRARVVAFGDHLRVVADVAEEETYVRARQVMVASARARFAQRLAGFAELCDDEQRDRLAALLRPTGQPSSGKMAAAS